MTYSEVLNYLYDSLPMFQRQGAAAFNKNLDRTILLLEHLGNPQEKFKSIHVAGTNGKGTTSHMLSSVLQSSGYKTGLYTSPHLKNFTERIRIDGIEASEAFVVDFVVSNKDFIEKVKPSFFELTVAMAFEYFAREKVDIAVIEVGMGGRLDSTNVITPLVSVITNISLDHQQYLGETLVEIAGEKAGIIKKGIPVVIGEYQAPVFPVFQRKAKQMEATLFKAFELKLVGTHEKFDIKQGENTLFKGLSTDLKGGYVLKNILGVIMCLNILKEKYNFNISEHTVHNGLAKVTEQTGLKGRWQKLGDKPLVICDTGHNIEGVRLTMAQLKKLKYDQLIIIWGSVADKDVSGVLALLPTTAGYIFSEPSIPRKLEASKLAVLAEKLGLKGKVVPNVNEALQLARKSANKNDCIYIGGSTFLVADINEI